MPALDAQEVNPRLLAPESANWGSVQRYGDALLAHPTAGAAIDIVATHSYGDSATVGVPLTARSAARSCG